MQACKSRSVNAVFCYADRKTCAFYARYNTRKIQLRKPCDRDGRMFFSKDRSYGFWIRCRKTIWCEDDTDKAIPRRNVGRRQIQCPGGNISRRHSFNRQTLVSRKHPFYASRHVRSCDITDLELLAKRRAGSDKPASGTKRGRVATGK